MRLRHGLLRGSVLADGLVVDTHLVPLAQARARILARCGQDRGARVLSGDGLLLALWSTPQRLDCAHAGGSAVVRLGELWTPAPLDEDELRALEGGGERLLWLRAGAAQLLPLAEFAPQDPASWLELEALVPLEVSPLGERAAAPDALLQPPARPLRTALALELSEGGEQAVRALLDASASNPSSWWSSWREAIAELRSAAIRTLAGLRRPRSPSPHTATLADGSQGTAATAASAALVERPGQGQALIEQPGQEQALASAPWWQRLRAGARLLASRALLSTRLARLVGRQHARYLSRLLEMFDDNQLDDALRHAIPLGATAGEDEDVQPALRPPAPRRSLDIEPGRKGGAPRGIAVGDELFATLRKHYRAAFERLLARGEIEKAAFVLAELLHEDEEAVQFLERHQRLRLAAELAEARGLAPGLVIRQWMLAKDIARALHLARRLGAFAEAVLRLEQSHPEEARALRLLWAHHLADTGAFAAAVEVAWTLPDAEQPLTSWLERAIELGGPTGARMLVRRASRFPQTFAATRDRMMTLLADSSQGDPVPVALAEELVRLPANRALSLLARPLVRSLLARSRGDGDDLLRRVLLATGDAALRAEVQAAWGAHGRSASGASLSARGAEGARARALTIFLDRPETALAARGRSPSIEGDAALRGVLLAVAVGRREPSDTEETCLIQLERAVHAAELPQRHGLTARAHALAAALQGISRRWYDFSLPDSATRRLANLTAATLSGDTLLVAHVGVTRAYLVRAGVAHQLTEDGNSTTRAPDATGNWRDQEPELRILGGSPTLPVDLTEVRLRHGDCLVLCTSALWRWLSNEELARHVAGAASPRRAIEKLWQCVQPYDAAVAALVVARFEGATLAPPVAGGLDLRRYVVPAHDVPADPDIEPLALRRDPVVVNWPASERGPSHLHDAALLPDGKLLLALGEAGACVLARDGRVVTRFFEPTYQLVLSDHGDRAIAIAPRGPARRLAKLDLLQRRAQPWCDVSFDTFAPTYDGSLWFVAKGDTAYAIDATASGWEHLWKVDHRGSTALALARDARALCIWFGDELWSYELPALTLRRRAALELPLEATVSGAVTPAGAFLGWVHVPDQAAATLCYHPANDRRITAERIELPVDLTLPQELDTPPSLEGLTARLRTPVAAEHWNAAPVSYQRASTLHLYQGGQGPRALLHFEGEGCRLGARFCGSHLLVFDSWGRVLLLSLVTGEVLRRQLV